jgi:hypothetical protein
VILSALVAALLLVPGADAPVERPVPIPAAGGVTLAGSGMRGTVRISPASQQLAG